MGYTYIYTYTRTYEAYVNTQPFTLVCRGRVLLDYSNALDGTGQSVPPLARIAPSDPTFHTREWDVF